MSQVDLEYNKLCKHVLEHGMFRSDRTGTNTFSVFGYQARYDLRNEFPLLTTKKVHFKSVVGELLWFLEGSTSAKTLKDKYGVSIWDEWADENGELGPVYGHQWRKWQNYVINDVKIFTKPDQSHIKGSLQGIGNLGDDSVYLKDPMHDLLYQTWYGILKRCYNPKHPAYSNYGGKGVFVDDRWLIYSNFFQDIKKLDNWILKATFPDEYSLDKDFYGSNKYGPDTCRWASKQEQSVNVENNDNYFVAEDPTGYQTIHFGLKPFCYLYKISSPAVSAVLKGIYKKANGWKFFKLKVEPNKVVRYTCVDQIKKIIAQIKHQPNSRDIVVSAWNVRDLPRMQLKPCHLLFQFYVNNGELSCMLTQRSADIFLGVPFNIASYALLTHMIAQVCGLKVGELVHSIGDAHIYSNHLEQIKLQLSREPRPAPKLFLSPGVDDIDNFTPGDIILLDYDPHPTIKGAVAV